MNIVTPGVVLSRRTYGEYGRIAAIYTRDLGKVAARFAGVDRPQAKLKAFSEPMIWAEYRLYMRPGSPWVTVTGGRLVDCYPGLRTDLDRMLGGLEMCELLLRLTPEHAPSRKKYELITEFLSVYAQNSSAWLPVAFGLRLLELLGLGPEESGIRSEDRDLYRWLLSVPVEELSDAPGIPSSIQTEGAHEARLSRLHSFLLRAAEAYLQRPLNVPQVRASIAKPLAVAAV